MSRQYLFDYMMTSKQKEERQATFTAAHHDYEKGLGVYAFFKIDNRAMSEDMVQDTFLKTWKYLLKGKKIVAMKGFLYHILNNLIVDEYRNRKHNKNAASLDTLMEKGFEPDAGDSGHLFAVLDGRAALLLIKRLPTIYQKVMRMRYVQNLSIKEISAETGKTKNATAVQLFRGLEKLKLLHNPPPDGEVL